MRKTIGFIGKGLVLIRRAKFRINSFDAEVQGAYAVKYNLEVAEYVDA